MNRRAFLTGAAGAGLGVLPVGGRAAAAEAGVPYYHFRFNRMTQGDRPDRAAKMIQQLLPIAAKYKIGPLGYFTVTLGPETPTLVELMYWPSLTWAEQTYPKLAADSELVQLRKEFESAPEPPFDGTDSFLVRAASYSPELKASPADQKPRLFELRIYHSPTYRQLADLHERFSGAEVKIFHRCGVHPILYGETAIGRNMPNLVYMIPFDSLAEREKAWTAFGADPEWKKVRAESVQKSGNIVSNVSVTMLQAAAYSPIR
jgi:hypothetical protein